MEDTQTERDGDEGGSTRRRFLAGVTAAGAAGSTLAVSASGSTNGPSERGTRRDRAAQTWEMYAADVRNTGRNGAAAPTKGVGVNWYRDIDAHTEATFDRLTTYVGSADGTLYALREPGA